MHEALVALGVVADDEARRNAGWSTWLHELAASDRATRLAVVGVAGADLGLWVAAERLAHVRRALSRCARCSRHRSAAPNARRRLRDRDEALRELLRARLGGLGPATAEALAAPLGLARSEVERALLALQAEGYVLQGRFTPRLPAGADAEWCERHLLARIHRYTLKRLRREIEPVEPRDFVRFLFDWQRVGATSRVSGPEALAGVLGAARRLRGAGGGVGSEMLPARVQDYAARWLDDLCTAGRTLWTRLRPRAGEAAARGTLAALDADPAAAAPRRAAVDAARAGARPTTPTLGSRARARRRAPRRARRVVLRRDRRRRRTCCAPSSRTRSPSWSSRGRVHCDSFAGLRALLVPPSKRAPAAAGAGAAA